ncbi:MAG: GAF domain-containing protein [Candidatus Auribacter fodinae]|jgi:sigma-B regulation protein RsbU (phosphoserine phosphatase)|uniref:GAF domain-containing protein n=1 Tax=Candidatus Auribacter fodinae TaxID=2093366 RepID=A0A3A4R8T3_9BACT|nr:MAG: GAF domain-containing protein [Candidatus Auribacter fodinae]
MVDFLREIGTAFSASMKVDDLLNIVMHTAKRATDAGAGAIYLVQKTENETSREMKAYIVDGLFPPLVKIKSNTETKWTSKQKYIHDIIKSYPIKAGEGILGKVLEDGRPRLVECNADDNEDLIPQYKSEFLKVNSIMAVPLKVKSKVLGVMAVVNKRYKSPFRPQDLSLLESLAEQAAVAISNIQLSLELAARKQLEWEIRLTEDLQALLLPKELPKIHGFDLAALSKPVRTLGGDYYDIVKLDYERYGLIIADVSGKGVPGAITIAIFRSLFRNYAIKYQSPAKVLIEINNWLYGEMKEDMFITALYAILYPKENKIIWSRAGHEPILYYSNQDRAVHSFSGMGLMMGMTFGKDFDPYIEENEIEINTGDVVALYTDGVIEVQNDAGSEFGRTQLSNVLRSNTTKKSQQIIKAITNSIIKFSADESFQDDLTLLVLKKE